MPGLEGRGERTEGLAGEELAVMTEEQLELVWRTEGLQLELAELTGELELLEREEREERAELRQQEQVWVCSGLQVS